MDITCAVHSSCYVSDRWIEHESITRRIRIAKPGYVTRNAPFFSIVTVIILEANLIVPIVSREARYACCICAIAMQGFCC